jgi:cbb3-type cytochrome oxidase subunit 3
MIQNVLRNLGGIERYGIVSLVLFFAIFSIMVIWAFSLRKQHLNKMANMPLESDDEGADSSTDKENL